MHLVDLVRQFSLLMSLPAVIILCVAAALIVIVRDWRIVLLAYAVFSVVLALLLAQALPTEWALLQAIAGGLVAVMLFLSGRQLSGLRTLVAGREGRWPQLASLTTFRLLAVIMAVPAFLIARGHISLPAVSPQISGALLWLALMGMMGLALHEEPLHAGLALLMIIGGFQLLLFALTQSRLMVGLLDGWQMLIGLAVSYLTVARGLAGVQGLSTRWHP